MFSSHLEHFKSQSVQLFYYNEKRMIALGLLSLDLNSFKRTTHLRGFSDMSLDRRILEENIAEEVKKKKLAVLVVRTNGKMIGEIDNEYVPPRTLKFYLNKN